MTHAAPDKLHYLRIPKGYGARAEMVRMTYVLAGKPYVDVFTTFAEAPQTVAGKNPFRQLPFIETSDGRRIYQSLAIMHHVARGTSAWPSDPDRLTDALSTAMGGYDLYQAFAGFSADDPAAKKRFEERRAPQYLGGFDDIYSKRAFAAGDVPTFADCIVHQAVAWVLRRNEVCRNLFGERASLKAFHERFEAIPVIHDFMAAQASARERDDSI